jgi:hypothetical protein
MEPHKAMQRSTFCSVDDCMGPRNIGHMSLSDGGYISFDILGSRASHGSGVGAQSGIQRRVTLHRVNFPRNYPR